jgi:hypothetical protein
MFESETSTKFKAIERQAATRVTNWFAQDEIRAEQQAIENNLNLDDCFRLPLASAGVGEHAEKRLRDQLGIPIENNVAIFFGSLEEWSMAREIVATVIEWPDDWSLIVHERYGQTESFMKQNDRLHDLIGSKIFPSDRYVDMVDGMGEILAGVSVGIALYRPNTKSRYTGNNLKYLGLASGKISTLLRHGVPVIINAIGLYADLARLHDFGVVVDGPRSIPDAIRHLRFEKQSRNAKAFFMQSLDFNLYSSGVWAQMLRAAGATDGRPRKPSSIEGRR